MGTSAIPGVGTTITFSLPGLGATQVFVPHQSIFLPNHQLQTGEKVRYSSKGGSQITVFDGTKSLSLPQDQDLYVASLSQNFVGISTVRVGLGTTGKLLLALDLQFHQQVCFSSKILEVEVIIV